MTIFHSRRLVNNLARSLQIARLV